MATRTKVPVTERALLQRLNRKLAADGQAVRSARGEAAKHMGRFFTLDWRQTAVTGTNVDIEELGRELEVLQPWERLTR